MKPEDTSVKTELYFKWFYSEDSYRYNNTDHWPYIKCSTPLQLAVFPITVMEVSWWWVNIMTILWESQCISFQVTFMTRLLRLWATLINIKLM